MSRKNSVYSKTQSSDHDLKGSHSSNRPPVLSIFAFIDKTHLTVLIPALFLTTIAGAIKPTLTIFLGHIFDDLTNFGSQSMTRNELLQNLSTWCTALTGLGIITILVNGGSFGLWLMFGELQAKSVREKLFLGLLEKEVKWYDLQANGIGSLLSRTQTQVRELQAATSQPLGFFLEDIAVALTAVGISIYYSWNLTLVILAFVPITVVVLALSTRQLQPAVEAQKCDLSEASKHSHTAIKEVDTVKAFNGQDQEVWKYTCAIKKAAKSYMIQANANSLQMGITRFMTMSMFVVGFWYGVVLVRGGLNPGGVLTTFYSCLMATQAMEALLPQWLVLSKGISAGQTLKYMFSEPERDGRLFAETGVMKPITCHGDVEVSKLTFSYPSNPGQCVIQNESFFFPVGETTFVIGRSGSGKSTLGNLLMKFYKPSSGNLLVDGNSIELLDVEWLRSNICFVQQESILFNENMFQNIAFGRQPQSLVTEHEVKMASQMALLQETINDMPKGFQTMIGKNGNSLSGGQKQRVAIARARLHDAPILILDEATSALDPISRSLIMEAIRKWRQGRTTIIITHDISDIKENDYVYVLDEGKIVQEGYRRQLLEDKHSTFASFASMISDDNNNPFSDEFSMAASTKVRNLHERMESESYADPHLSNDSEDDWLPTRVYESRLRRVSRFFGLDGTSQSSSVSKYGRVSHGIVVGAIYVNTLHGENVWGPGNISSFSRHSNTTISKPPPTVTLQRSIQKCCLSNQNILDNGSTELEMLDVRGQSTQRTRSQRAGQCRSRTDVEYGSYYRTPLSPEPISERAYSSVPIDLNSHERDFTLTHILGTVWLKLGPGDRFTFILGFVNAFISASATPAFSYVFARLLGTFSLSSGQTGSAETWALAILAIAITDGISTYYMHYFLEYSGQTWVDTLRAEALMRILAQSKVWLGKLSNNPGRLNECLDRNAEEMRSLVGRFAGYVFLACSMMSIAMVWAFVLCWKLTLVVLASGPCMYAFTRAFEAVSGYWEKRLNDMSDIIGDICAETFSDIKVIRALNLESYFKQKHAQAVWNTYTIGIHRAVYTSVIFGMSDSSNTFVIALILYYGTLTVAYGSWSVESVLQVITLLVFSSGNANTVIAFIPQISSLRTTGTQMLRLANMPKTASHESQGTAHLLTPFPICLNSLSFSYPSEPNLKVLHEVSMTFHGGSCTAIVGSSGSGKSTIASLLLGLQPPKEPLHALQSSITFAGTSVFSCSMNELRSHIVLVTQHPVLFPSSITSNITYGLPAHSPFLSHHAIQAAAKAVGIHDFILSLPKGYNTIIGEGGRGLSGGQAQRLCIARALVRRPRVLVLDEPTSALDGESARIIKDTIVRLTSKGLPKKDQWNRDVVRDEKGHDGMAVILITHNVDMMRVASRIFVLEQGRVVQEGSFEELARCRGVFSKLISGGQ